MNIDSTKKLVKICLIVFGISVGALLLIKLLGETVCV